jgi:stalled ribosome alternative rescue factor ArfA
LKEMLVLLRDKCLRPYMSEISTLLTKTPNADFKSVVKHLKQKEREHLEWNASSYRSDSSQSSSSSSSRPTPADLRFSVNALNPRGKEYQEHLLKVSEKEKHPETRRSINEEKWCWMCGVNGTHQTRACGPLTRMRKEHGNKGRGKGFPYYCVAHCENASHDSMECETLVRNRSEQVRKGKSLSASVPEYIVLREEEKKEGKGSLSTNTGGESGHDPSSPYG